MTLMIELPRELEERLKQEALRRGLSVDQFAVIVLEEHLPRSTAQPSLSLPELLAKWSVEDTTQDPEELARRQEEWEELARGLDRNRTESGGSDTRRLFPWLDL